MADEPIPIPPRFQLSRMVSSIWIPQAIYAAAKLGLAEALAAGPLTAREVAEKAGTHAAATARLLRALAVLEIVAERDDGRLELTELGRCLDPASPDSVHSWAMMWGGPLMWPPWGQLSECVRTGDMAPKFLDGVDDPFTLMERNPENAEHFNSAMLQLTRGVAPVVPMAYDFSEAKLVADVGGGFGALLVPVLQGNPGLRGLVCDLERCAEGSRELMAEEGLADRCDFQPIDFFESVPSGPDVYLMKSVIHDWDDEKSRAILECCRDAMSPEARLLVCEWIVPDRVGPDDAAIVGTDLNMLVMVGGQERTESEYRALIESAGLRVTRIVPTLAGMSLIEAAVA